MNPDQDKAPASGSPAKTTEQNAQDRTPAENSPSSKDAIQVSEEPVGATPDDSPSEAGLMSDPPSRMDDPDARDDGNSTAPLSPEDAGLPNPEDSAAADADAIEDPEDPISPDTGDGTNPAPALPAETLEQRVPPEGPVENESPDATAQLSAAERAAPQMPGNQARIVNDEPEDATDGPHKSITEMIPGLAETGVTSAQLRQRRQAKPTALTGRLSRAATAGQYFEAIVTDPEGLSDIEPHGLRELGLAHAFDEASGKFKIAGTLHEPGVYEITLAARRSTEDVAVSLRLNVSPDPWSIWKDLPVDWDALRFPKDDLAHDRKDGALTLLAASRRGRSHAHKALPRDDDAGILYDPETTWHIGIVADGAGSAQYSRKGSELAVTKAMAALPELLEHHAEASISDMTHGALPDALSGHLRNALSEAAQLASYEVDTFASKEDLIRRDFSTTLLIGVARHLGDQGWLFASFSIGDGAIALIEAEPVRSPLMITPDSGEFAGQTVFLETDVFSDQARLAGRFHARIVDTFTAFLLATDGISDAWFNSDSEMADPVAWQTLWQNEIAPVAGDPEQLADWLNFKVKGEHDDRTLVVMVPPDTRPV